MILQVFHKWEFHKTVGEGKLQYEEPETPPEHPRPRTRSPFQVPHSHPNTQPRSGTSHSRSRGVRSQLPAFAHTPPAPSQEPGVRHSAPGSGLSPAPRVRAQPWGSREHTLHPPPQPRWDAVAPRQGLPHLPARPTRLLEGQRRVGGGGGSSGQGQSQFAEFPYYRRGCLCGIVREDPARDPPRQRGARTRPGARLLPGPLRLFPSPHPPASRTRRPKPTKHQASHAERPRRHTFQLPPHCRAAPRRAPTAPRTALGWRGELGAGRRGRGGPEDVRQAVAAAYWSRQTSLICIANDRRPGRGYRFGFLRGRGDGRKEGLDGGRGRTVVRPAPRPCTSRTHSPIFPYLLFLGVK